MVDQKLKARALHRAKIIKGQVDGLAKAVEKEEYCMKLLSQSLSIQRSLKSLDALLLENHLKTHVRHQMKKKSEEERAVRELMDIFQIAQ